eukprot:6182124-Pleurochrysis_carterae.AAC.1
MVAAPATLMSPPDEKLLPWTVTAPANVDRLAANGDRAAGRHARSERQGRVEVRVLSRRDTARKDGVAGDGQDRTDGGGRGRARQDEVVGEEGRCRSGEGAARVEGGPDAEAALGVHAAAAGEHAGGSGERRPRRRVQIAGDRDAAEAVDGEGTRERDASVAAGTDEAGHVGGAGDGERPGGGNGARRIERAADAQRSRIERAADVGGPTHGEIAVCDVRIAGDAQQAGNLGLVLDDDEIDKGGLPDRQIARRYERHGRSRLGKGRAEHREGADHVHVLTRHDRVHRERTHGVGAAQ